MKRIGLGVLFKSIEVGLGHCADGSKDGPRRGHTYSCTLTFCSSVRVRRTLSQGLAAPPRRLLHLKLSLPHRTWVNDLKLAGSNALRALLLLRTPSVDGREKCRLRITRPGRLTASWCQLSWMCGY